MPGATANSSGGFFARLVALLARNRTVFGSDVYNSYTFEYVWGANQFGHVLIGLFPSLLLIWLLGSPFAALIVVVVYAAKEAVDYRIAVSLVENVFQPNKREAIFDGAVDWAFVTFGAFVAAAVMGGAGRIVIALAFGGSVLFFLVMRFVYLPGKISFDRSGLPKFVRLPTFPENFDFGVSKDDAAAYAAAKAEFVRRISDFAANASVAIRHVVIAGPRSSGRSTFAMAIGGEAATGYGTRPVKVRYVSGAQLHEITNDRFEVASKSRPWCVGEAEIVIVDELDPLLVPTEDADSARLAIDRLIDVKREEFKGLTVFERPLGVRNRDRDRDRDRDRAAGAPKWIPAPGGKRALPRIVWVAGYHGLRAGEAYRRGENLRQALAAKFGTGVELVKLEGKIFERRTKTKVRAPEETAAGE